MNLQTVMTALPWIKRVWRLLPPQGRVVVLLLAAVAGIVYSLRARGELHQEHDRAARAGSAADAPPPPA